MTYCEICGEQSHYSPVFDTRSIRSNHSAIFSIGQCQLCGVRKVMNVPPDLSSYYKNDVMKQKPGPVYTALKSIFLQHERDRIIQFYNGQVVLDIGAGIGDLSLVLHKAGINIITVDTHLQAPIMTRHIKDIPYLQIDYDNYVISNVTPFEHGTAILRHVLEHVIHPERFLKRLVTYGISSFYIVVPNHGSYEERIFGRYNWFYDPPLHLWFFKERALRILLGRLNLAIKAHGYDTIPNILPSIYRFLYLKGLAKPDSKSFDTQGVLNSLCTPLNALLPNNVLWFFAEGK